ncbi:MAG: LuxR family transcriptional regulator [Marmoricola sp.]|nr:LuxR family transcriptional regulator [Marmoricola sp.]
MRDGAGARSVGRAQPQASGGSFLEVKLRRPPSRGDWVRRERLMSRMGAVRDHPVTLIAAPVGYGKTILAAQWLEEAGPRSAWLSLDPDENDPCRLRAHVAAALERADGGSGPGPATGGLIDDSAAPGPTLSAIVDSLAATAEDIVVVLDDFHVITGAEGHAQIEHLVEHLPPQAHLVILTRADPGLRLGRLRASGDLLEIRADDLAFTVDEAEAVLAREGATLDVDSTHRLMGRTEGWPAGLYLAGLSLAGRADPDSFVRDFSGGNRFIGDYLVEEVLARHSDDLRTFIESVSVLDRFSPDLCDHVTGTTRSGMALRELERTNLFLVPLDDDRHWYRFHHLLAAVARSELDLHRPGEARVLHARAAEWFSRRGNVDEAVRHSIAAGDLQTASMLVEVHWLDYVDAGRIATVLAWLKAIGPLNEASDPAASATAAWMAALVGDEAALRTRLASLTSVREHGPLPDGSRSVESATAMIAGLFGYGGPGEMMRGAERAVALETDRYSPFYAVANAALGHAAYVRGDLDRALAPLVNAWRNDRAPVIIQVVALAIESLVQDELGETERARERADSAMELLDSHGLRGVPQASLAFTAHGRALAADGAVEPGLATLARGLSLRRESPAHGPWGMVDHLIVHSRVAAEAGHAVLARRLLDELDSHLARFTEGLEAIDARVAHVRRLLHDEDGDVAPGQALTDRELDILRILQGTMSLHEISEELYLSSNTVKTHARAIYRKLGVHARADAVVTGRRQGFI